MADPLPQSLMHACHCRRPSRAYQHFFSWGVLMTGEIAVKNNAEARSYDALVDGEVVGSIVYELAGERRVVFTHTFVMPQFRERGVGNTLARTALDDVR